MISKFLSWFKKPKKVNPREKQVKDFFLSVNESCYKYCEKHKNDPDYESAYDWYFDKLPSYKELLESNKPLLVSEWMPKELNMKLFIGLM